MAENVVIKDTRARLARVLKRVNAIEAIEAQMGIDRLVNPDVTEKQEVTTKVTEQSKFEDRSEEMRNKEDHTDASSSPGATMVLPHRDFLLTRATSDIGKLMAARKVNNRELRVRHALGTIRANAIGTQVRPDLEADVQSEGCSYDENAEAIADGTAFNVEGSEMLRFSSLFGEEYKREEILTHDCQGTRHC
jgi:hypothetical protein